MQVKFKPQKTILVYAALLSLDVSAHGGRLNAAGCHNDRKNGSYHCHRAQAEVSLTATKNASKSNINSQTGTSSTGVSAGVSTGVFKNCAQARAAGAAPVLASDPRYGKHLDRDGDGIGCE